LSAASPRLAAARLARRRSSFKLEKYIAEPHPVRSVLGNVPLQNCRIGFGPLAIERTVPSSVLVRDCCTLVLRRSAGWRRTAERTPELRPAKKWTGHAVSVVTAGMCRVLKSELQRLISSGVTYKTTMRATCCHLTFPCLQSFNDYDLSCSTILCML
jgi:hypothetical protein